MKSEEEKSLQKYIDYKFVLPNLFGKNWINMFNKCSESLAQSFGEHNLSIGYNKSHHKYLQYSLSTPRKMKDFFRELQSVLDKFIDYINVQDLMLLSALKCSNLELYTLLPKYKKELLNTKNTMDFLRLEGNKSLAEEVLENKLKKVSTVEDVELLKELFLINGSMQQSKIPKEYMDKIINPNLFDAYFYLADKSQILSISIQKEIDLWVHSLDNEDPNLLDKFKDTYANYNQYMDYINFSLDRLYEKRIEDIFVVNNIIEAQFTVARDYPPKNHYRLEKCMFTFFRACNDNKNKDKIITMLAYLVGTESNVISSLKSSIIFYTCYKDDSRRVITLDDDQQMLLKQSFINWCRSTFLEPLISIFDGMFDDPAQVLYRYTDCIDSGNSDISDYFEKLFCQDELQVFNFMRLIDITPRANLDDLNLLINLDSLSLYLEKVYKRIPEQEDAKYLFSWYKTFQKIAARK